MNRYEATIYPADKRRTGLGSIRFSAANILDATDIATARLAHLKIGQCKIRQLPEVVAQLDENRAKYDAGICPGCDTEIHDGWTCQESAIRTAPIDWTTA